MRRCGSAGRTDTGSRCTRPARAVRLPCPSSRCRARRRSSPCRRPGAPGAGAAACGATGRASRFFRIAFNSSRICAACSEVDALRLTGSAPASSAAAAARPITYRNVLFIVVRPIFVGLVDSGCGACAASAEIERPIIGFARIAPQEGLIGGICHGTNGRARRPGHQSLRSPKRGTGRPSGQHAAAWSCSLQMHRAV